MSTQLLIVCLCVASGTFVGLFLSKKLVRRAEYLGSVVIFINSFMSEVKFRKQPSHQVIQEFSLVNSSLLNKDLALHFGEDSLKNDIGKGLLKKDEANEVKKLLGSLGTLDSDTQLFELENYKLVFSNYSKSADERRKKFAPMYIKLGFLAGLALGIILL